MKLKALPKGSLFRFSPDNQANEAFLNTHSGSNLDRISLLRDRIKKEAIFLLLPDVGLGDYPCCPVYGRGDSENSITRRDMLFLNEEMEVHPVDTSNL